MSKATQAYNIYVCVYFFFSSCGILPGSMQSICAGTWWQL